MPGLILRFLERSLGMRVTNVYNGSVFSTKLIVVESSKKNKSINPSQSVLL